MRQTQPLLLRGDRVETLKLVGFPLGIYDDLTYEEWSLVLDPKQTVALYAIFSNINIRADRAAILGGIRSHRARRLPRQRHPQYDHHILHRTLHWATTLTRILQGLPYALR